MKLAILAAAIVDDEEVLAAPFWAGRACLKKALIVTDAFVFDKLHKAFADRVGHLVDTSVQSGFYNFLNLGPGQR